MNASTTHVSVHELPGNRESDNVNVQHSLDYLTRLTHSTYLAMSDKGEWRISS